MKLHVIMLNHDYFLYLNMPKAKNTNIDVMRSIFWYDSTYLLLKIFKKIKTHNDFAVFFHQLNNGDKDQTDPNSGIFWKIKMGRVTLGQKWLDRIEEIFPISLNFYNHFIWETLKHTPMDEYTLKLKLKNLPANLQYLIFEGNDTQEEIALEEHHLQSIKALNSLDGVGLLYLLHLLGRYIGSIKLTNDTASSINQMFENLSKFQGLERAHLLLFDELSKRVYQINFIGYNKPLKNFFPWRTYRDKDWDSSLRINSQNAEQRMLKDKYLKEKLSNSNLIEQEVFITSFH